MSEVSEKRAEDLALGYDLMEVDTSKLPSVTLARLVEEIRNEETPNAHTYDRVHNRHNRGR